MISKSQPAPQRQRVLTFVTPKVGDILFYEVIDAQRVGVVGLDEYRTPHPDTAKWPNHKLVHVAQDENSQFYRYYYAADRASQDDYNYELQEGRELTRTYVIPREDYPSELPVPAGGTPDVAFTDYGFTSDSIINLEEPLNGIYIAIQRKFGLINTVSRPYDANLERNVTITRTLKPSGFLLTDPEPDLVSGGGIVYDVEHGNDYHDVLVKTESGLNFAVVDYTSLPTIYSTVASYPLPPKLTGYTIHAIYAEAFIDGDSSDYAFSQDFMAVPSLIPAARGPYKIKIERFITPTPESVIDFVLGSATKLPATKEETAAVIFGKATYGTTGAFAQAFAREFPVPEAYHFGVTPTLSGALYSFLYHNFTDTPGFSGDLDGEYLIDLDSKPTSADLYEVTATSLVLDGVY